MNHTTGAYRFPPRAPRAAYLQEPQEPRLRCIQVDGHFKPGVLPVNNGAEALEGKPARGVHAQETGFRDQAHTSHARLVKRDVLQVRLRMGSTVFW